MAFQHDFRRCRNVWGLGGVAMGWTWWPVLVIPFPYMEHGLELDLSIVDDFLHLVGGAVGPLVVFVAVFLIARRLYVSFSGGD